MTEDIEQWLASLVRLQAEEDKMTEKQIKIIEAAVEMFAEKGYSATSTSEIAQKAGVAEGTIFRHYKTKKDLLISIIGPTLTKLVGPFILRDVHKIVNTDYDRFEDFLRAMMRNRLEFVLKNADVIRILLHEIPFHPELRQQFIHHIFPQVAGRLEWIIRHFQAKGELVAGEPYTLIRMAASAVAGYILTRSVIWPTRDWNDDEEIERTVSFVMHGLTPRE